MNRLPNATRLTFRTAALAAVSGLACGLGGCANSNTRADAGTGAPSAEARMPTSEGDLLIDVTRKNDSGTVRVGEPFTYTIQVTNTSDEPLTNVRVKEATVDSQVAMVNSEPQPWQSRRTSQTTTTSADDDSPFIYPGWSNRESISTRTSTTERTRGNRGEANTSRADFGDDGRETSWNIGDLAPGESKSVRVTAVANDQGLINSCLTADYDRAVCTTVRAVAPDLTASRTIKADGPIYACDDIQVTYTVENTGTGTTDPVTLNEQLPQGVTADGKRTVDLSFGRLKPGQKESKTVTINAGELDRFGGYATAKSGDMSVRTQGSGIDILNPEISLSVDGPQREYVGRGIQHVVTVTNTSDDPAKDVVVQPQLPGSATNISSSNRSASEDNEFTARFDTLAPGESRRVTYTFDADEPGVLSARYLANAYCVDRETAALQTQIVGIPAIRVEVYDTTDPVRVGDTVRYEVRVKNQGSADGIDIRLVADVPEGMSFEGFEGDRSVSMRNGRVVFEPIPRLQSQDSENWTLLFNAESPGRTRLQLETSSQATNRPVVEQEPTNIVD